jgi:hypothetical protein
MPLWLVAVVVIVILGVSVYLLAFSTTAGGGEKELASASIGAILGAALRGSG